MKKLICWQLFLTVMVLSTLSGQDTTVIYKKAPTRPLGLNFYYPHGVHPDKPTPAIVFFFGGGWVGGNPHHFHRQCMYLAKRGMMAIAADYRIKSKDGTSPISSIMDAKSAMRWVRKNAGSFGIDPQRLAAGGGSAGGHLAASTAIIKDFDDPGDDLSVSPVPNALLLFNPVIDVSHKGYGAEKVGTDSIKASPLHQVTANLPPTMIFHGTNDKTVPFENVEQFEMVMKEYGNECEVVPFTGRGHGFFNWGRNESVDYYETLFLSDKFLIKHGYLKGHPTVYTGETNKSLFVQPIMAGEPTHNSIILQARFVDWPFQVNNDVKGSPGIGYFEVAEQPQFNKTLRTDFIEATAGNDYILKKTIDGLQPSTKYFYRLMYGETMDNMVASDIGSFETLPGKNASDDVSFVMVTGSHYQRFFWNWGTQKTELGEKPSDEVLSLGFPGHKSVRALNPDFYIGNGDNVYYDHVKTEHGRPDSLYELRGCWHRQFSLPRFQLLLKDIPVYWMKDDHDYRFDDADTTTSERFGNLPSHQLGVKTFLEQVPVKHPTYRTYRINKNLQIWMLEGRDYRSPNTLPDNENKTIWGDKQKKWLKETLLESDATFKLVISPTPMIGPDDKRKTDNHTNIGGFRTERDHFFNWLIDNGFLKNGVYLLCGDRHWQYHSIHPTGLEELSCGALVDNNSRLGRLPGDPQSTDPEGRIKQPYTQDEASGGFLHVSLLQGERKPELRFIFYDEHGQKLHEVTKKN